MQNAKQETTVSTPATPSTSTPAEPEVPTSPSAPDDSTAAETPAEPENPAESEDSDTTDPIHYVPIGDNPQKREWTNGYLLTYTFLEGEPVEFPITEYYAEATDEYGITYKEYRPGANDMMMKEMDNFIKNNPDCIFTVAGDQIVVVSSYLGLWNNQDDLLWATGIVDCDPADCLYLYIAGTNFDEDSVYAADDLLAYTNEAYSFE